MCDFQYNATKIVFSLAKDLLNQGYCIYVDYWYTSLELCAKLWSVNTNATGTLCENCKDLPKEVVGEKCKPSEGKVQYEKNVGVMCLGWKSKRDAYMMSTCTADNISNVTKKSWATSRNYWDIQL